MANIIIRFNIFSNYEPNIERIGEVKKLLPQPDNMSIKDDDIILTNNIPSGKKYKATSFGYKYEFKNIHEIKSCSYQWLEYWKEKSNIIDIVHANYGFDLILDYQVTIFENNYPELYLDSDFLFFLGKHNITLCFYYYNN